MINKFIVFSQPFVDAPPYIGINLAVNGKAIFSQNLLFRRQPSANRIERLARPREKYPPKCNEYDTMKPDNDTERAENCTAKCEENTTNAKSDTSKAEDDAEKAENDANENRTHNDESKAKDMTARLKLKENNLTLNYDEKTGVSESLLSNMTKSRNLILNTYQNDLQRRWKSVQVLDSERISEPGKPAQLRTLSMDPSSIKPKGKKTFENKFLKTKNQGKAKKLKISREEHADNNAGHVNKNSSHKRSSHVNKDSDHVDNMRSAPRVITIPEVGTPRTILRYTDKRYGRTKTVAIDMGPEKKFRKNAEVVIN